MKSFLEECTWYPHRLAAIASQAPLDLSDRLREGFAKSLAIRRVLWGEGWQIWGFAIFWLSWVTETLQNPPKWLLFLDPHVTCSGPRWPPIAELKQSLSRSISWLVVSRLYFVFFWNWDSFIWNDCRDLLQLCFDFLCTYEVPLEKIQIFSLLNFEFEVLQCIVDQHRVDTYFTNSLGCKHRTWVKSWLHTVAMAAGKWCCFSTSGRITLKYLEIQLLWSMTIQNTWTTVSYQQRPKCHLRGRLSVTTLNKHVPWILDAYSFDLPCFIFKKNGRWTPLNPWIGKKMRWNILGPQWHLRNYVVLSRITWWFLPKWSYFRLVNCTRIICLFAPQILYLACRCHHNLGCPPYAQPSIKSLKGLMDLWARSLNYHVVAYLDGRKVETHSPSTSAPTVLSSTMWTVAIFLQQLEDLAVFCAGLSFPFGNGHPHDLHERLMLFMKKGFRTVRGSLVTLPTFWSLVTLPTLLGRVASDPLVLFLWPCSLKNTSPRILFLVVACDPTYLFGRVARDHFLALAIPKHLPWPDLHSDRIWPYSPTCHRKHGFCVAGATISMPLRCSPLTLYMLVGKCQMAFCVAGAAILMPLRWSPLTLYMLVGKCQMAFVWQVQQFRCLWDVLPWPYTCWLGSVKWLLSGRCSNFDASEMILPWPYTCLLGRVKWLLCGRCNNFDASEMFSPDPIHACLGSVQMAFEWQVQQFLMPLRWSPLTLYMLVGKGQMAFVWQVQQFRCLWDDLPWPYTCLLGSVKWLLCGRCSNFDASEMISSDPIHACWEGSHKGKCVSAMLWAAEGGKFW